MSEKMECNSEENANQDDAEKKPARKKSSKWEAVPIPMGGAKPIVQNANQDSAEEKTPKKKSSNWEAVPIPMGGAKPIAQSTNQDSAEEKTPKKKSSNWEAVPIPMGGGKANTQRSYLDNSMDTASHAIKGKDQKENWQRIQRTTFTNWINNRLQGS